MVSYLPASASHRNRKEQKGRDMNTISMPVQGHSVMITMEEKPGLSQLET